ncbi:MAG: UDP-N-acetylmuramoyl-L-alanyl-D-glutamate--2,6-diaminopimelate ligase [Candidatus Omnitrophota bacterium]|jgi:UDP-N-acetylmuramoyl-L-alanyl-D-glutamate--2,6-diaminopimelate ligase|nr:MAG: UDP-N-acetylmuramoyl-L-alanyl-D-glutamate--2,6-diaminopimelate ligase [Candidatus Omnitrophota bacterium]
MVEGITVFQNVDVLNVRGGLPARVVNLCCDSRTVCSGDLFIALRGDTFDGHDYLSDAAARGACGAVVERWNDAVSLPQILVADTLASLPKIAANFYSHPSRALRIIGVTGSNGKTTSTYFLESIWRHAENDIAVIGTIEYRIGRKRLPASNTTPLPHEMQRLLRTIADEGIRWVVMEVSSHGLALHRVDEIVFTAALFTNLSQDHLDFHKTMNAYRETKTRLFTKYLSSHGTAVLNLDDEAGKRIHREIAEKQVVTYSVQAKADIVARSVALGLQDTTFTVAFPDAELPIRTRFLGLHNVYNILGAAATAWACRIPHEAIRQGIEQTPAVPGRLEIVPNTIGAQVVVDYCHTPDAMQKCLQALQTLPHRRLITVFGCGGDRDAGKRPMMGEIALRYSDHVIVTSDNPRTEDPLRIIRDIEAGMTHHREKYKAIPDRREALRQAIRMTQEEDILLIAGKGHETYQIIGREKFPFDDREIAKEFLINAGKGDAQ